MSSSKNKIKKSGADKKVTVRAEEKKKFPQRKHCFFLSSVGDVTIQESYCEYKILKSLSVHARQFIN